MGKQLIPQNSDFNKIISIMRNLAVGQSRPSMQS